MSARLSALVLTACVLAHAVAVAEPLRSHPALVDGALDNGVQYRVKSHSQPAGSASLRLYLPVGSFNEADDERGYAHLLEHLAFAGSKHFPPGEVVPHFEALGLTLGRHQNAYTGVDQTVYMLDLPDASDEALRAGLTFLADTLARIELRDAGVEQERAVVLAEHRLGLGPGQRLMEQWFPRLLKGSLAADRLPIGTEATIRAAERDGLEAFYRRWYTAGNATVVFVGDVPVERARGLIAEAFGDIPAGARTEPVDPGTVTYGESFAVVATDPEIVGAQVGLMTVGPERPPALTEDDVREQLIESLAAYAFNRRVSERIAAGQLGFRHGGAQLGPYFGVGRQVGAGAFGEAAAWRLSLEELAVEVQRVRALGFSEREVDDARQALLARARQFARTEDSVTAGAMAQMIVAAIHDGRPVQSGTQRLDLLERLLPGITADEVTAVFADGFDPERMAVTVFMADGEDVPDESDVLAIAVQAFGAEVAALDERERAGAPMAEPPEGGTIVEGEVDDATGVYAAWLANGARMHHRHMDYRRNQVGIRILLAGGAIEEDADSNAYTLAAVGSLTRPATRTLTSTDVRDLLVGRTVRIGLTAYEDSVSIRIDGPPDEIELALQIAHLLLSEPRVEPIAFGRWRESVLEQLDARRHHTGAQLSDIMRTLRYPPDDPRWQPLTQQDIERLDAERVQGWVDALFRRAPISVAVVGDLDRDTAVELVRTYIGSLPARSRIGPGLFDELRAVPPPARSIAHHATIESVTPQATVLVGFAGADDSELDDVRTLRQAASILSIRMARRIREQEGLVYGIGATHRAGIVLPGFGLFGSSASTDPDDAERVADLVEEMYAEFAESGPTDDEAMVALRQFDSGFRETAQEPAYWLGRLETLTYRGEEPVSPERTFAAYRALTAARIHEVFRRYYGADRRLRVIVSPDPRGDAGEPM